ncbi:hypothetical protein E5675_15655 [Sphingopyxis sp. PAMC25046]|uniref:hypothetical protein n=1 Tax=Sphingopyxis sp. PAMC25046 TaxID=2565556 RepID=UPI00109D95DA|nr:hypothetical protein [Sphingopyxis sp. PAMC25046]QCB55727.1 hypothetical protein E5675_15655 [Sphingopyxis sp. PAMC25046]
MRVFYLVLQEEGAERPCRVDFNAADDYQAFQQALNVRRGQGVELWEGERLLVRMTKSVDNLWKLLPRDPVACPSAMPSVTAAR